MLTRKPKLPRCHAGKGVFFVQSPETLQGFHPAPDSADRTHSTTPYQGNPAHRLLFCTTALASSSQTQWPYQLQHSLPAILSALSIAPKHLPHALAIIQFRKLTFNRKIMPRTGRRPRDPHVLAQDIMRRHAVDPGGCIVVVCCTISEMTDAEIRHLGRDETWICLQERKTPGLREPLHP